MYFHFVLASIHFHQHYNNQLRILLVGPVGAGKSSFFNSIFRVRPSPAQQTRVRRSRCRFSHQHTNKPALGRHQNTSSTVNCVFISLAIPKLEHQGWEKGETLRHNGTGGNDQSGSGHRGFGQHPQVWLFKPPTATFFVKIVGFLLDTLTFSLPASRFSPSGFSWQQDVPDP